MKLQTKQVEKPFQKLRKQLKAFPSNPKPKDVHSLRTQTRRLEATVAALAPGQKKTTRTLIKLVKPVRKAAGKVRDIDVFIGDMLTISSDPSDEAIVRLIEHLAKMRSKHAQKLGEVVQQQRGETRHFLSESLKIIRRKIKSFTVDGETGPQILITELRHWPELREDNLHLFRIRVKELRYMLQLSQDADAKLLNALGEVKDAVGEWHDWMELLKIAGKVLDPESDRLVLKKIENTGRAKLLAGLDAANKVRQRYFRLEEGGKVSRKILPIAS